MVTMSDVARAAGVSRATVSYALRGDPRITESTASRIRQVAADLHYNANLSARSLRSGRTGVIGVAIFELDRPYPSEMGAAMSREIARRGYQPIVQQTSGSKDDEVAILRKVTSQLCDGMIFSPAKVADEELRSLSHGKPMVLLDDLSPDPVFDSVATACEAGAQTAVGHLIEIGCRHIVVVGAPYEMLVEDRLASSVRGRRLLGSLRAFEQADIEVGPQNFFDIPLWTADAARASARRMLEADRYRGVDGVFCLTDTVALGFMRGLADCGVRVPDDLALIGFDGIAESEYSIPSLSTIRTNLDDLSRKAVGLLIDQIEHDGMTGDPQRLTADFDLVVRESTQR
ncbi:Periplasmic binding protein-like domain-containing protein [Bifidobacterium ramosum]|nr:LacI family DNA-binding transcriptional regulator [Bifidobacterium ramosum]KAB8287230.1 Periplasmic binding protein-like domain-containing protein [Bifidobacterium ramosum]